MSNPMKSTLALGLLLTLLASSASSQQQQLIPSATNAAPASSGQAPVSVPSSLSTNQTPTLAGADGGAPAESSRQWPIVNVDNQANKSTVGVHVPIFFDMTNHADKDSGKNKLDLTVLQGLVTVNKDKSRDQNGDMTGPVKVTVFGIPVYTSKGSAASAAPVATARSGQLAETNSIDTIARKSSPPAEEVVAASLTERVQKINEKMISSLSDILERFSSSLRRPNPAAPSSSNSADDVTSQQMRLERDRANPVRFAPNEPPTKDGSKVLATLLDGSKEDRRIVM